MLHAINLGCGKALPDNQMQTVPGTPKGYTHYTVMGTGATLLTTIPTKAGPRTFWVRTPVDYDPNHKYRVVYIGQGCGGYNVANTMTLQLFKESSGGTEEAIYVALDIPTDMANQDCYDNRDGPSSQEWEAFELFHDVVDSTYCVDNDRVYVSGYSTGGWLTDMWGCYFAGDGLKPWNGIPGTLPTSHSSSLEGVQLTSRAGSVGDACGSDVSSTDALSSYDASSGDALMSVADAAAPIDGDDNGGGGSVDGPVYVPTAGARKFAPEYHIRAQAGVSGGEPDNDPPCNGPVAAIWIHDKMDGNAYAGNHDAGAQPRDEDERLLLDESPDGAVARGRHGHRRVREVHRLPREISGRLLYDLGARPRRSTRARHPRLQDLLRRARDGLRPEHDGALSAALPPPPPRTCIR